MPACDINGHAGSHSTGDARIDMREETYSSSQEDLKRLQNDSILKRIPSGAEATTVLVCIKNMICYKICMIQFLMNVEQNRPSTLFIFVIVCFFFC